jgi:hypothetical protein
MSGGYVRKDGLADGEHQVVIFTFKGPIDRPKCEEWNREINALKATFGQQVIGVTMDGLRTPEEFKKAPAQAAAKKKRARKAAKKAVKKGRKARGGR